MILGLVHILKLGYILFNLPTELGLMPSRNKNIFNSEKILILLIQSINTLIETQIQIY